MADCSFSTNLSNGAKAGILGLLIGGMIAAFKGLGVKLPAKRSPSPGPTPPPRAPRRTSR